MSREETQQPGMTPEQVLFLIQELSKENQKAILAAVQEMKKPDEYEQAKRDKERNLQLRKAQDAVNIAMAEEQKKQMLRNGCRHAKPDGKHTWVAQVNSEGYFRPTCIQCLTQLPKIKATTDQLQQGVNLNLYPNLTIEGLEKWAAQAV